MRVEIQYFKGTGKYYSSGEYFTSLTLMQDIFHECIEKLQSGDCPGLANNAVLRSGFAAIITVPDHPHNHPFLFVPDGYGGEES